MIAQVLKQPVITEKSLHLANTNNTYTFEVDRRANKHQVKLAVEQLYQVKVVRVNTTTLKPARRRTGRRRLPKTQAPVKKALVTLKEGDTIELFDTYQE